MIMEAITKLVDGHDLSQDEAAAVMNEIMDGEATPAQFSAFVTALRMKGETPAEIAAFVRVMHDRSLRVEVDGPLLDTCGTGGDRSGSFNVSTAAAFVVAGTGVRVAKHGNRAASGATGSADSLEALGVNIDLSPHSVARCVREIGFGFMFAQRYHPSMRFAASPTQFSRAMGELGVQLIFARSPQAKGRVERTAGTLQDRLVSELWLAGATTIDDANRVLQDFLPRFNSRFKVPAQELEVAYRAVDGAMCLERVLCFKYRRRVARDNTVRYRWRTLQLLPGTDRPSYAGAVVDVLEGLDGSLEVEHEGRIVPSREAPPRPSVLRGFAGRTGHTPVSQLPNNGLGRRWIDRLPTLDATNGAKRPPAISDRNGTESVRQAESRRRRKPTALQTARWKAVQKAKRKGLSIRGIARELGIHRDTVRKYMNAESPPLTRARARSEVS